MINLGFKYDAERYKNTSFIPETGSKTQQEKQRGEQPASQSAPPNRGKRPFKVNLNFSYDPKRYENKSFIPEKGSQAEATSNAAASQFVRTPNREAEEVKRHDSNDSLAEEFMAGLLSNVSI